MRTCPICILAVAGTLGLGGFALLGGAGPAPAPATVPVAPEAFAVDNVHSSVIFRIKHNNVSYFYGRFNTFSGSFAVDGESTTLDITVDAASVDTANEGRDKHVKSQDFFSVKEFPTVTFKSASAKKGAGEAIEVAGNLTFHGVTKPVTVSVTPTGQGTGRGGATVAGFETTFTIKRSDFGMGGMTGSLGDDVTITVSLQGSRK
jgi:polyisoprenoid-binding protein YceI